MTERDKIINIVEQNKYCDVNTVANCRECKYSKELENYKDMGCSSLKTADALIAAGIGDVTEWKERAEKAESQIEEQKAVSLYRMDMAGGKIDMTVGSEGFKDFFLALAQIFEQNNAKRFLSTSIEIKGEKYGITIQKVGKKTVAEELNMLKSLYEHEKHRVEVAERALFNMTKKYILAERKIATTKDGQFSFDERLIALFAGDAIKQAEKELAEEEE